jgi:hypothetical protein
VGNTVLYAINKFYIVQIGLIEAPYKMADFLDAILKILSDWKDSYENL